MRLLTHNQLVCVRANCTQNFPLRLVVSRVEHEPSEEPNLAFIQRMLPQLEYPVLRAAAASIGLADSLPETLPAHLLGDAAPPADALNSGGKVAHAAAAAAHMEDDAKYQDDETLLLALHATLMDYHVQQGALVCDRCNREYKIEQGIPNMRLSEEEA